MTDHDLKPENVPHPALSEPCTICNAKPGEPCGSLLAPFDYREIPHARRIEAAKNRS